MIDLAAITAAREAAQAVEREAAVLADRLVAAKADRRQLRRDLAILPGRLAAHQQSLVQAQARLAAAQQAHAEALARVASADAQASRVEENVSDLDAEITSAQEALNDLLSGDRPGRPPLGGAGGQVAAARAAIVRLRAQQQQARVRLQQARQAAAAVRGQMTPLTTELNAAQAAVATLQASIADIQAALDEANARRAAVEALPDDLRQQIAAARVRVAAAWVPWEQALRAAHAAIAASPERESHDERAALLAGDAPEGLLALLAADVPLVLLPVRLETRFDRSDAGLMLLVRIYPDTIHVDSHEPDLTDEELEWGRRFLLQEAAAGADEDAAWAAWRQLADRFGPARAAWIAQAAAADDPPTKAEPWTRAASTHVLPDRWLVLGYRDGTRRFGALGRPIAGGLAVGPDPAELAANDPAAPLGARARWLVDFDRAVDVGMGIRVPLDAADAAGFDRLLVVGIRPSSDAEEGARRLRETLAAHRYTDGLAFVTPGTPTNNTGTARSGWNAAEAGDRAGWRAARSAPLVATNDGSDGDRLARALGLDTGTFAHVAHAGSTAALDARHMRSALWPATWGYMLEHLVGGLDEAALAAARTHFLDHVADAGPLATLRAGRQPYGVLPVTSLQRWRLLDPDGVSAEAPPILRALAGTWGAGVAALPRVHPGAALEDVLGEALEMSPVSVRVGARSLTLPPPEAFAFDRVQAALAAMRALGLALEPALSRVGYADVAGPVTGPFVAAAVSDTEPLPADANYITWLADSGVDAIRAGAPPAGGNTLLFALLRHAVLRTYVTVATRLVTAAGLAAAGEGREPGLGGGDPSPWERLAAPLPDVTGDRSLASHLDLLRSASEADAAVMAGAEHAREFLDVQASLRHLATLPGAALARLAAGTLDLASHRLDAWMSAHASHRLDMLRAARPTGAHIGGYGVLEDVRPSGVDEPLSHGYIHAPSLGQAASAAVLRSGYLAHRREDASASPLAVDLSSRRVRLALHLLDGVRAGQPLGAVLGYRFERGLHEQHPGLSLDRYIAPLRALAPLDALTEAEQALRFAEERERSLAAQIGQLEQRLTALRDADRQSREALRATLGATEAERDDARREASSAADRLRAQQDALQALLDEAETGGPRRPLLRFGEVLPQAGMSAAARQRLTSLTRDIRTLTTAADQANARLAAAAARHAALEAQLLTPSAEIAAIEQALKDLQPELEAARAAVVAARARVAELRAQAPPLAESIRANNVVDGLALRQRWQNGRSSGRWDMTTVPFGDSAIGLPALGTRDHAAIDAELATLDAAVDALSDLLLAEGVHQLVQGNAARAGSSVDALARGDTPPADIEIVRTPRAGTGVTHRVLVLLDPSMRADGWPASPSRLRAQVEPLLDAFAGRLLGPATRFRVRVRFQWPDGEASADGDLGALGLSPLDILAMAPSGVPAGASPLEARIADHFAGRRPSGVPDAAAIVVDADRDPAWSDE
ncbi:MAG: hypothetical protein AB7O32_15475, partial [Vicinamibacterales bacterium]